MQTTLVSLRPVVVEKRSSIDYLRQVLAWQGRDAVVMPVDPHVARLPDGLLAGDRVTTGPGGGWYTDTLATRHDPAPAQISITSGTTGKPKPILLSHRALGDVTERLIDVMALDDTISEYIGVPVTFSFGFGRVRAVAAAGGRSFLPENGFRVDELAAMLGRGEVNALSAVPTLVRLLIVQRSRLADVGDALRWLEIGSQAMSPDEKRAVRSIFPNARIVQHYGLTEASRTTFLRIDGASDEELETVGRPTGAVAIRISERGQVEIRGPHVADGVITADGLVPLADREGWLETSDLGAMSGENLRFLGRSDDVINVGGVKVNSDAFEEALRARIGSEAQLAVTPGSDPLRGQQVVVAFRQGEATEGLEAAAAAVAEDLGIAGGVALMPVDTIPRTETNKVRRKLLTEQFEAGERNRIEQRDGAQPQSPDGATGAVADIFVRNFGDRALDPGASFQSLGGDSLRYVNVLLALEDRLPGLPADWDTHSIAELAALTPGVGEEATERAGRRLIPANLDAVRGLACILIVVLHVVGVTQAEGLRLPPGSAWHHIMDGLTLVRLPLFTFMAGFLYAAMPVARVGYGRFMRTKFEQILPPLLFATFVFWALRSFALGKKSSLVLAYVDGYQHLWYLDALLLIFAGVAAVDLAGRNRERWLLAAAAIAMGAYLVIPDVPVLHVRNALFLTPFFIGGLLLFRRPSILSGTALPAAALLVAAGLIVSEMLGNLEHHSVIYDGLRWICGIAISLGLLRFFPRVGVLEAIAPFSFTIYLWHPAANGIVRSILLKVHLVATWPLFLIGLSVGVIGPIVIHLAANRMPAALRMIVAGR